VQGILTKYEDILPEPAWYNTAVIMVRAKNIQSGVLVVRNIQYSLVAKEVAIF